MCLMQAHIIMPTYPALRMSQGHTTACAQSHLPTPMSTPLCTMLSVRAQVLYQRWVRTDSQVGLTKQGADTLIALLNEVDVESD